MGEENSLYIATFTVEATNELSFASMQIVLVCEHIFTANKVKVKKERAPSRVPAEDS